MERSHEFNVDVLTAYGEAVLTFARIEHFLSLILFQLKGRSFSDQQEFKAICKDLTSTLGGRLRDLEARLPPEIKSSERAVRFFEVYRSHEELRNLLVHGLWAPSPNKRNMLCKSFTRKGSSIQEEVSADALRAKAKLAAKDFDAFFCFLQAEGVVQKNVELDS